MSLIQWGEICNERRVVGNGNISDHISGLSYTLNMLLWGLYKGQFVKVEICGNETMVFLKYMEEENEFRLSIWICIRF